MIEEREAASDERIYRNTTICSECCSENPLLTGVLAAAVTRGRRVLDDGPVHLLLGTSTPMPRRPTNC
ncbi:hypothetical protein [Streptomyces carpaticus]|uniref:Uncharacterized protein n=1 Tax=Streptomyces carpaticus TaxID=285558 RepID=A0ABV4ZN16_9ACTN